MGLFSWMFSGDKAAKKYQGTIQPYMDTAKDLSSYGITQGKFNIDKAMGDLDYLTKHFMDILNGSPDHILQDVDASSITAGADNAFKNITNNAVRGGMRAGSLGNIQFDKASAINKAVQALRMAAPDEIKSIAQMVAQIGSGQLQMGADQNDQIVNMLNMVEQVRQNEAKRKAGIFGSVLGLAGSLLGGGGLGGGLSQAGAGAGRAAEGGFSSINTSNILSGIG